MVSSLMHDTKIDLTQYVRLYRLVMLYAILHHYPKSIMNQALIYLSIKIDKTEYLESVEHLKKHYNQYKHLTHLGYPISQWCVGLENQLPLEEPLTIRFNEFPLYTRGAVSSIISPNKRQAVRQTTHKLEHDLSAYNLEDFYKFVKTSAKLDNKNIPIVDWAYSIWLVNAYAYYYSTVELLPMSIHLSDHDWDTISKMLGGLKLNLNKNRYPVLFEDRYEPGQSLFWLKKDQYPSKIRDMFDSLEIL